MKYLQNGSFRSKPLMRLTLVASLIFLTGFWLTTAVMFFSKLGFTPADIAAYYRGSEAEFTLPRTFGSMLEVTHGHLPVMAMVALLLTHLFIFTPYSTGVKKTMILTLFGSAFVSEAASWLVRFVHPAFAWLKLAAFYALEISLLFIIYALVRLLFTPPPSKSKK